MRRGFTLIELLVVIAIVAVLAVTVILTLNPAQLLRQARDSNRTQDLSTMKSAISLYLADVSAPGIGASANCYAHTSSTLASCTAGSRFAATGTVTLASSLGITGSGWIPVNFTTISAGSPISALPVDPVNSATYFYAYRPDATNGTFEMNADMESTKFASGGSSDVESTDGGNVSTLYEVGTDPGLDI